MGRVRVRVRVRARVRERVRARVREREKGREGGRERGTEGQRDRGTEGRERNNKAKPPTSRRRSDSLYPTAEMAKMKKKNQKRRKYLSGGRVRGRKRE